MAFGKPGRPHEDRLLRQREIFDAVAPLILERGARRVTMRDAARAAYLSVGGLYHYFPTKRDLLLHPLTQDALDRFCSDFLKGSFSLKADDPRAFLDIYAEFCARTCLFVRPAARAAVELGTETFWPVLEASMQNGLDNFLEALRRVAPGLEESELLVLAQSIRRVLLAGMFDRSMTATTSALESGHSSKRPLRWQSRGMWAAWNSSNRPDTAAVQVCRVTDASGDVPWLVDYVDDLVRPSTQDSDAGRAMCAR